MKMVQQPQLPPPMDSIVVSHHNHNHSRQASLNDTPPPPLPPPPETSHRAVHRIRLSALDHNYACVEAAASRQKCSVIAVIKADGYGHGAIATALHLADVCGCDAFAVATLEEGIALRKAFENNPPGKWNKALASLFHTQQQQQQQQQHQQQHQLLPRLFHPEDVPSVVNVSAVAPASSAVVRGDTSAILPPLSSSLSSSGTSSTMTLQQHQHRQHTMRPARIRILVLGPMVGVPRCFDDYYHYDIECMVSGPEVARALMEWVVDEKERKRTQVERAAAETKAQALSNTQNVPRRSCDAPPSKTTTSTSNTSATSATTETNTLATTTTTTTETNTSTTSSANSTGNENKNDIIRQQQQQKPAKKLVCPSSTLNAVQGQDLFNEVRAILMNQNKLLANALANSVQENNKQNNNNKPPPPPPPSTSISICTSGKTSPDSSSVSSGAAGASDTTLNIHNNSNNRQSSTVIPTKKIAGAAQRFGGIEAAAKSSRHREMAAVRRASQVSNDENFASSCEFKNKNTTTTIAATKTTAPPAAPATRRKTLRWHAMVDSGMGRLGFRPEEVKEGEDRIDTVTILQELIEFELGVVAGQNNNGRSTVTAPILEFYGLCTHMADAKSTSNYTQIQIEKFISLLQRTRAAGIFIPTVSTDNSSALLTTNLTHFDPKRILSQSPNLDTRGYVRTGGAIYGQRPQFSQLHAVSTLLASVRHICTLKKGESVGYDRAYTAPYDNVRIATLAIGFADGYPRELGNGVGRVAIRGATFPVAGNVCMDMMMVELGPAFSSSNTANENNDNENVGATVAVGDTAVLWGPLDENDEHDGGLVRLSDIAATLKTTQSALTCGLDKIRVRRQFVN